MAWTDLKAAVAAVIKTNGNQEITGSLLQSTLNSIIDQVGANASYKGVATPSTVPGTPDALVFYIASTQGTYANFGGFVLDGGFAVLSNVSGSWTGTKFLKTEMDAKADHGYMSNPKTLKQVDDSLVQLADNKQNNLATDGTGTKFPTVDAVNAGLVAKTAVKQTTGTSTTDVMSQKAVTDELVLKAAHGYDAEETPKTLKQVEDSLAQFANSKEAAANKQDSLATDGTGTKFPTVDAVNLGLATKVSELLAAAVYISANDYQMLIDNELVDPDVEYNIYEE